MQTPKMTTPSRFNTCRHVAMTGLFDCDRKLYLEQRDYGCCVKHWREAHGMVTTGDVELDKRIEYWQNELGVLR